MLFLETHGEQRGGCGGGKWGLISGGEAEIEGSVQGEEGAFEFLFFGVGVGGIVGGLLELGMFGFAESGSDEGDVVETSCSDEGDLVQTGR